MPNTIVVSQNTQILGDSSLSEQKNITCEAIDKVEVSVPHGSSDMEVDLFTGLVTAVHVLAIKANQYPAGLSYKAHTAGGSPIVLDSMQLLVGAGEVGLLGADPDKLFFSNSHISVDAIVTIFVGRDATP